MPGEELTRFPIQPQDTHRTAKSSDDIAAEPEEQRPGKREANPQDKPVIPRGQSDRPHDDAQPGVDPDDEDTPDPAAADDEQ